MMVFRQLTMNAFRECIREPVYFLTLILALVLIGFLPATALFVFRLQLWMVLDNALALTLLLGFITAVLCASHCIRREMTNGTVLLLLSKPVSRFQFIASKIIGIDMALAIFALICCSAAMCSGMIASNAFYFDKPAMAIFFLGLGGCCLTGGAVNYFAKRSFTATSVFALAVFMPLYALIFYQLKIHGDPALIRAEIEMKSFILFSRLFPSMFLLLAALLIAGAMATAFATRFSFLTNLILCLAVFLGGLVSGPWIRSVFGSGSFWGSVLAALIPNWQYFWMSEALVSGAYVPGNYLLLISFYVLLYGLIWTVWAVALFQNSE